MIETIRFPIAGMTCSSCVNRITRALRKLDGVEQVKVDLRQEAATVGRDPGIVSDEALGKAVAAAGYEANVAAAVVIPTIDRPGRISRIVARLRP